MYSHANNNPAYILIKQRMHKANVLDPNAAKATVTTTAPQNVFCCGLFMGLVITVFGTLCADDCRETKTQINSIRRFLTDFIRLLYADKDGQTCI